MSCPNKPTKYFLGIIPYGQPHHWEIVSISKHIPGTSDTWKVRYECKHCGCRKKRHFVKDEELLRSGFTIGKLLEIDDTYFATWHRSRDTKT